MSSTSRFEDRLPDAGFLEGPHVMVRAAQRVVDLDQVAVPFQGGVGSAEAAEAEDAVGGEHAREPGRHRTPVVTEPDRLADPESVEQAGQVGDQVPDAVTLNIGRRVGPGVAALARHDHPESGGGDRVDLVTPGEGELGEAVEEKHRRAFALLEVLHLDSVGGGPQGCVEVHSSSSSSLPMLSPAKSASSVSWNRSIPPLTICSRTTRRPVAIQAARLSIASG